MASAVVRHDGITCGRELGDEPCAVRSCWTARIRPHLKKYYISLRKKLQAEREEAARKQEELQAQLQAQQAALEENQSLLRQAQEEVKGMHTKFKETNALLRVVLKLQKD
uniref:Uncharacterized protein n=1 Tax=Zea mays TaxID=4577 RepID=A0A804M037_MAIZE